MSAGEAQQAILAGKAPNGLTVTGELFFYNKLNLKRLPDDLQVDELDIFECKKLTALPRGLRCHSLALRKMQIAEIPADTQISLELRLINCTRIAALPASLSVQDLALISTPKIERLPADLRVTSTLTLSDCARLEELPPRLPINKLAMSHCPVIEALPEGLQVQSMRLSNCERLTAWPRTGPRIMRRLTIQNCPNLRSLPPWLFQVDELTLSNCPNLREVPAHLHVRQWMEIDATTPLRLPTSSRGVRLRWRGVPISGQAAFYPQTLKAKTVLKERNAEIRRVMLERMGYERFMAEAQATTLDRDRDAGGSRRLLHIPLEDDEPLVCLAVLDPSTGRQYLIRVPPGMQTCHQAAAWIAGFENPEEYHPIAET
jgi:hypothetical protein